MTLLPASLAAILFVAVAGVANADDARMVPAAGTSLTFRLLSTTKTGDMTVMTGQIYTYIVKSSDGTTAEGTIRPDALIFGCAPSNNHADCAQARKMANAKQEDDRITVPIPRDLAEHLAAQSVFRSRYFMPEMRRLAQAMPRSDDPNDAEFGPEPAFVVTNSFICPAAELDKFVPLGRSESAMFHCRMSVSRTAWPAGHAPAGEKTDDVTFEVTYQGKSHVSVAAGEWDVENLSYKSVQTGVNSPNITTELAFSPRLGVGVKSHSRYSAASGGPLVFDTTIELIAVSP